jgi:oligopeptide/dipeptide ABC transporter ATP-binding protein
VARAVEDAGLKPAGNFLTRRPHELSGGQRQRVVIAGALVLEPSVLLADEPVSMLDVSIRAEILNLLAELRQTRGIAILFITHDLSTVAAFADRVAVMYLGKIVEIGPTQAVLQNPQHPYTKALLSVVPVANPRLRRERIILQGETPDPVDLPTGCRFHPRCPAALEECRKTEPPFVPIAAGHQAACLRVPKTFYQGERL